MSASFRAPTRDGSQPRPPPVPGPFPRTEVEPRLGARRLALVLVPDEAPNANGWLGVRSAHKTRAARRPRAYPALAPWRRDHRGKIGEARQATFQTAVTCCLAGVPGTVTVKGVCASGVPVPPIGHGVTPRLTGVPGTVMEHLARWENSWLECPSLGPESCLPLHGFSVSRRPFLRPSTTPQERGPEDHDETRLPGAPTA